MGTGIPGRVRCWIQRQRRSRAARFWGDRHRGRCPEYAFWLAIDQVMHWVNRKVSGDPRIWPLSWFLLSLPKDRVPVRYALSIGCGPGNVEREALRLESASRITGIDISSASLEVARGLAEEAGYGNRVAYRLADAETWLRSGEEELSIDVIFFHASLHHIEALENVLELCAAKLREGNPGLVYVDEYVGPGRDEWTQGHLGYAAALFDRVPVELRQYERLRPPVARRDPTEMIRSSEIERVLRSTFEIVEYRPYFGNVVMPLVCGIRPGGLEDSRVRDLLDEAMRLEDYLIARKLLEPMHAVFVGKPLPTPLPNDLEKNR
jgi:SAM-dependent methyltransferase